MNFMRAAVIVGDSSVLNGTGDIVRAGLFAESSVSTMCGMERSAGPFAMNTGPCALAKHLFKFAFPSQELREAAAHTRFGHNEDAYEDALDLLVRAEDEVSARLSLNCSKFPS
jgi:hypothetical protein